MSWPRVSLMVALTFSPLRMRANSFIRDSEEALSAVSGVAGPTGGTPEKPVGFVCFAWGMKDGKPRSETKCFSGDREAVRKKSVEHALKGVLGLLADSDAVTK